MRRKAAYHCKMANAPIIASIKVRGIIFIDIAGMGENPAMRFRRLFNGVNIGEAMISNILQLARQSTFASCFACCLFWI